MEEKWVVEATKGGERTTITLLPCEESTVKKSVELYGR